MPPSRGKGKGKLVRRISFAVLLIVFLAAMSHTASAGTVAALDEKNGFRDLTFGDPIPKGMHRLGTDGKQTYHIRTTDDLTIGGAHVTRIVYWFYEGHFASAQIETTGFINSHAVLDVLRDAYGSGFQANQFLPKYLWSGDRVILFYDENIVSNDAIIWFKSKDYFEREKADNEAKSKKGVGDL